MSRTSVVYQMLSQEERPCCLSVVRLSAAIRTPAADGSSVRVAAEVQSCRQDSRRSHPLVIKEAPIRYAGTVPLRLLPERSSGCQRSQVGPLRARGSRQTLSGSSTAVTLITGSSSSTIFNHDAIPIISKGQRPQRSTFRYTYPVYIVIDDIFFVSQFRRGYQRNAVCYQGTMLAAPAAASQRVWRVASARRSCPA